MKEENILDGLRQSNIKSYEALIEQYSSYVARVVMKVSGAFLGREAVEEITADVFIKCWQKRESLKIGEGKLKPYLAVMARNHALNRLRAEGRVELIPLEEDIIDFETPEHEMLEKEEERLVHELLELLPEPDREIFIRRYFYMERVVEIGNELSINSQTVATKLFRAKKKLQTALRKRGVSYE